MAPSKLIFYVPRHTVVYANGNQVLNLMQNLTCSKQRKELSNSIYKKVLLSIGLPGHHLYIHMCKNDYSQLLYQQTY
ncbi:hypothetical protein ACB092_04G198400 [Castanea dentata]